MAAVNMTEGNITNHLVRYSVPLILGNLFQLTYNAVDSIIAGRFIVKQALAAEGGDCGRNWHSWNIYR